MSFNIGLSGIRAASTDLEVTGNNVANASTIGFKNPVLNLPTSIPALY